MSTFLVCKHGFYPVLSCDVNALKIAERLTNAHKSGHVFSQVGKLENKDTFQFILLVVSSI